MEVTQGDRIRLVVDVVDDAGDLHRAGDPGWVVGMRGFTHVVVAFDAQEYALVGVSDIVVDNRRRS